MDGLQFECSLKVTVSGRAETILKESRVTRPRYIYQVTAAALHLLQVSAFQMYIELLEQEVDMVFQQEQRDSPI